MTLKIHAFFKKEQFQKFQLKLIIIDQYKLRRTRVTFFITIATTTLESNS